MSSYYHPDVYDGGPDEIVDNADKVFIVSALPASYTEASSTYKLGSRSMTVGDGNGDYSIGDRVGGGRQITVAEQSAVPVTADGTATHIAFCDSATERLLHAKPLSPTQALSNGTACNIPETTVNIGTGTID